MALEMNMFKDITCPVSLCTSFTLLGEVMFNMALTFSELAFTPHCETMNLENLPDETPNTHFAGSISSNTSLTCQKFL